MSEYIVEHALVDLDGCLGVGPRFTKEMPLDLTDEMPTLRQFMEFMRGKEVRRSAVTGRSLIITRILIDLLMNDLPVAEHGTVLYDPRDPLRVKHLVDEDVTYSGLRDAKETLERFIAISGCYDDYLAKGFEFGTRHLHDNLHIYTVEVDPKTAENSEVVRRFLHSHVLPADVLEYIEGGQLRELTSRDAYDLMPAVSKRSGVEGMFRIRSIKPSRVLAVGDSYHSDGPVMELVADGKGYLLCPANSDDRLKELVRTQGEHGYVAGKPYFESTMEGLHHFLDQ